MMAWQVKCVVTSFAVRTVRKCCALPSPLLINTRSVCCVMKDILLRVSKQSNGGRGKSKGAAMQWLSRRWSALHCSAWQLTSRYQPILSQAIASLLFNLLSARSCNNRKRSKVELSMFFSVLIWNVETVDNGDLTLFDGWQYCTMAPPDI